MTDQDLGPELSPDEESYFESGGNTEIPETELSSNDADGNAARDSQPEKMVALAALHEERTRRREIDRQHRETQQQLAELKGKFSVIDKLAATQGPKRPLTAEEDIFSAVNQTRQSVAQLQQRLEHREAVERGAAEQNTLVSAYRSDAAQFEARNPDFKAAYNHLLQTRMQELQAMGHSDPRAIHQALLRDEFSMALGALARRQSPAEMIYNIARQRGYAGGKGRGAERLDTIQRGQAANKSLSSTGGASGDADVSAEALLRMPMDEFEAWCTKNPARAKRLMGG